MQTVEKYCGVLGRMLNFDSFIVSDHGLIVYAPGPLQQLKFWWIYAATSTFSFLILILKCAARIAVAVIAENNDNDVDCRRRCWNYIGSNKLFVIM
jgi:hypothetical protein